MVTLSAAAVAGLAIALVARPIVIDLLLIHRMGSDDPAVRELAINQALKRGRESKATVRLNTDSNTFLGGVVAAFSDGFVIQLVELFVAGSTRSQNRSCGRTVATQRISKFARGKSELIIGRYFIFVVKTIRSAVRRAI